jgi:hypothetical protein
LTNWFDAEFILLKVLRLQPSELEKMEFYRAEYLMENLKKYNEEEENRRSAQEKEHNADDQLGSAKNMMKSMQSSMPNFNMPAMNIPKIPGF